MASNPEMSIWPIPYAPSLAYVLANSDTLSRDAFIRSAPLVGLGGTINPAGTILAIISDHARAVNEQIGYLLAISSSEIVSNEDYMSQLATLLSTWSDRYIRYLILGIEVNDEIANATHAASLEAARAWVATNYPHIKTAVSLNVEQMILEANIVARVGACTAFDAIGISTYPSFVPTAVGSVNTAYYQATSDAIGSQEKFVSEFGWPVNATHTAAEQNTFLVNAMTAFKALDFQLANWFGLDDTGPWFDANFDDFGLYAAPTGAQTAVQARTTIINTFKGYQNAWRKGLKGQMQTLAAFEGWTTDERRAIISPTLVN
jgi:uncharacterized protein YdhG (YjbR/CyaY superfamily)